jgi:hypothetical protein
MLLRALGCPMYTAPGEAEGLCASLSKHGCVDAIASVDSDVFPFGAEGVILKDTNLASADSAWNLEVVHAHRVRKHLGLSQQGLICLANLAGCDFSEGVTGIGSEKGMRCVRGLRLHCSDGDEANLKETLCRFLDGAIPDDVASLAQLTGCQTCRRCGHGSAKATHGSRGCAACGTSTGCRPRQNACPCAFHRRADEVVLARALTRAEALPSTQRVEATGSIYEGAGVDISSSDAAAWQRPDVGGVVELLWQCCRFPAENVLRSLLPALLQWDLQHPGDRAACVSPTAVIAESFAGLAGAEQHTLQHRSLVVLEWSIKEGCDPCGRLKQALTSLSRPRRAVSKRMLLRCRPDLVMEHISSVVQQRARAPCLARRDKNIERWSAEAERLCVSWGVGRVPDSVTESLVSLDAEWRREAIAMCSAQRLASARDPWGRAQRIIKSFGLPLDEQMREGLRLAIAPKQQTLSAVLQRTPAQATVVPI